jgi:hypothetical protein
MPTMAARPNPQLWYAGSAVDQEMHPKGYVFSGVRKRGIEGTSPRLCYLEWSPDDGDTRADPRSWVKVNPGIGYRPGFTVEYVADEFEAMKHTPKMFDVMRWGSGDWPTLADKIVAPINDEVWRNCLEEQPQLISGYPQVIGVDRDPHSKVWSIAGAQRTRNGNVHVEIGYASATATVTEVCEYLVDVVTEADPVALVIDARSPAAVLVPYLIEAGIEPHKTNASELAMACQGYLDAALAEQVSHTGQQLLTMSTCSAVKRDLPGGRFAWDKPTGGQIVHLMAATLAHWGLLTFGSPPKKVAAPAVGADEDQERRHDAELDVLAVQF